MPRPIALLFLLGLALVPSLPAQTPAQPAAQPAPDTAVRAPCLPVHKVEEFIPTWNNAVIGPGSRSHTCTLNLLTPDARITGVAPNKQGLPELVIESPAEFIAWYQQHPTEDFWERTLRTTITVYENVARIQRTYEVRDSPASPVKARGIEDFQLIFDGTQWRCFSLLWQDEVSGRPLPSSYRPN